VQPEGTWWPTSQFAGPIYSPESTPWFAYNTADFRLGESIGSMTLEFYASDRGRLTIESAGNRFTSKQIVPQDFAGESPSPIQGVGDMWWGGPQQNGWGVAILEQPGGLFSVWLTYDASGKPTWFVMPGGEWRDASTYAGKLYRTQGSAWVGAAYDPSKMRLAAEGSYVLRFADREHATLEYAIDGRSGALDLARQP
jgi:hypothetical protein